MIYLLNVFGLLFGLFLCGIAHAAVVELEDNQGRAIQADLVELQSGYLTFLRDDGKRFTVPMTQLSGRSQELVKSTLEPAAKETAKRSGGFWEIFFPNGLINATGDEVSPQVLEGKMVCLYFSASWCGPCKPFTARLQEFMEQAGESLEVVFVSQDRSESAQLNYMIESGMEWPAVKWANPRQKGDDNEVRELLQRYQAWGIPRAVILSPGGTVLDANAGLKIQFLPEENIQRLENFDYDGSLERYRAEKEKDGKPLTKAQEKEYSQNVRSSIERQIREFAKLREQTADARILDGPPTWEQLLGVFYASQR